jgi:hypothetical protein
MKASVLVILVGAVVLAAFSSFAAQSGNVNTNLYEQKLIAVDNLGAEYHSASGTIVVTAKIKNVSQAFLKGYATIYLLSAEGKKVHAFQEEVNGGEPFAHGTTVEFKATSKVNDLKKVASISVDFTQS